MQIQITNFESVEHPLIQPLYISLIGFNVKEPTHSIHRPKGFNNYVLIYCCDGKSWFESSDRKRMTIEKNTAILIRPGVPYSYGLDPNDPWSYYYIHIRGENAAVFFQDYPDIHVLRLDELFDECKQLLQECWEILQMGYSTNNMIYCSQLLGQLLTLLLVYKGESPNRTERQNAVQAAIRYMLRHIDGQLTLQQLCDKTHLSKSHFVNLFKKSTGFSPIDYFLRLKIQQACAYLDSTDLSVKEICFKFGFTDPNYFSRMFTKIMGLSPAKYRQRETV